MQKDKKIKYEAPALEVLLVELEQGIAAASATLSGGDGTTSQPDVEDWQDTGGLDSSNGDL